MLLPVLIFDYGNVVAYFDYLKFFDCLVRGLVGLVKTFGLRFWSTDSQSGMQFESGSMTARDFAGAVKAAVGLSISHEEFVSDWEDIFWLNEPVSQFIASLDSRGYTLILGSDTNPVHATYFKRRFAATLDRFDAYVLSYEVGCLKPDRRFYEACTKAAGGDPRSCVFIDDVDENVLGARGWIAELSLRRTRRFARGITRGWGSRSPLTRAAPGAVVRQVEKSDRSIGREELQVLGGVKRPDDEAVPWVEVEPIDPRAGPSSRCASRIPRPEAERGYGFESWCSLSGHTRRRSDRSSCLRCRRDRAGNCAYGSRCLVRLSEPIECGGSGCSGRGRRWRSCACLRRCDQG